MTRQPTLTAPDGQHDSRPPAQRAREGATSKSRADLVRYEGAGVAAGMILLLVAGAAVVIVVAQNIDRVDFEFLWWSVRPPLAVLLLITAFVVVSIDQIVGFVWRRRRRRVRELTQTQQ